MTARARAASASRRRDVALPRRAFRVSAVRLLAAVGLLGSAAALYGVGSSEAFQLDQLEVAGTTHAAPGAVRAAVQQAIGEHPNVFRIRTALIADALRELPEVRSAEIAVALPDRIRVRVIERLPILVLEGQTGRFLVDVEGRLFLAQPAPEDAQGLPVVRDRREVASSFLLGGWLDPVDLEVVRQLGALTPAVIGTKAQRLRLDVDDSEGWVLTAEPSSWRAVFGFYTSRTRPPELVPAQVQCLRALVATTEPQLTTVYLGRPGERCGTFKARPKA